jgi:hypothetical protein
VPYLDDSSVHQQMVRFAATRIAQGHLPLTSWFPYLGLGFPQFLHYQSLPSKLSGVIGTAVDPDTVFRWAIDLSVAGPLAARRLLVGAPVRLGRWTAAAAAAVSPLLASSPGIGYEDIAYLCAATACEPSSGRRGRCRWRGPSRTAPSTLGTRCAGRSFPPSSSSC